MDKEDKEDKTETLIELMKLRKTKKIIYKGIYGKSDIKILE